MASVSGIFIRTLLNSGIKDYNIALSRIAEPCRSGKAFSSCFRSFELPIQDMLKEAASDPEVWKCHFALCLVIPSSTSTLLLSGHLTPLVLFVPGMFMTLAQGLSLPFAQAGAMATIRRLAGTAAGIGVFAQNFFGAGFAQLYGLIADGTPLPMVEITTSTVAL